MMQKFKLRGKVLLEDCYACPGGQEFSRLRNAVAGLLLLYLTAACLAQTGAAPTNLRESAVNQARSGDPKNALVILKDLVGKYPSDPRLLADATVVSNWAGEDVYAVDLFRRAETPKTDIGVLEAAARSARNLHQYELATDLFARAESLAPDRWQPRLGQAMIFVDQGRYKEAGALMAPLQEKYGSEPEIERGQAYLCTRQQDFACAIAMYQKLIAQMPGRSSEYQCEMAQALSQLGGNTLVSGMCDSAEADVKLRILAATGAERVRWSEANDHDWQQRKIEGDQAITVLDDVIASTKPGDNIWKQAQSDRLVALYNLYRMQDVVQSWENLHKLGVMVPDYALARVAAAYLSLQRADQAKTLYDGLVERSPEEGDLWSGKAYAEFDGEQIQKSFKTIDQAFRNAPPWLQSQDLKIPQPNPSYASLGLQAAAMRGFAEMREQEQRRLEGLLALAPHNSALGRALAKNYEARGWPLRAIKQEQLADSFDQKGDLPVLEDAQILEGAGRRKEADAALNPVIQRYGANPAVRNFLRDRAVSRGWQGNVSSGYEWSNGRYIGNVSLNEGYLYSPFIAYRWRAYVHGVGQSGTFLAGSAYRTRATAGFSYNYDRQSFWGEAGFDPGSSKNTPTGAGGAQFSFGDRWLLRAQGDWDNVSDVQLIAEVNGIRAHSGTAAAQWRQSESRSIEAAYTRMHYSDGNQRSVVSAWWEERALTQPRLQIDVTPQVWASQNTEDQSRVYFNPKHDASVGLSTSINWVTWRHYDRRILQQFNVSGSPYWQDHYGINGAVSTEYTIRFKVNRRFGMFGRFMWNSHPYDGVNEPYIDAAIGMTWGDQ